MTMVKIEAMYVPWKEELTKFIEDLVRRLYDHLPSKFSRKMDKKIEGIVLGELCKSEYNYHKRKVYLSRKLLYERDPKKIAEVLFHEIGHPLLNDEFGIDDQISADFLAIYSVGSFDVIEYRKEISIKYYKLAEEAILNLLGDNKKFLEENKKLIQDTKKIWYPKLKEEIVSVFGIDPDKLIIRKDLKRVLEKVYPKYKEFILKHKKEDNPVRKLWMIEDWKEIEKIFTTPIKELSGHRHAIPHELAREIEKRTGIFIGYGGLATPLNNISYSLVEIIEKGMKFEVKHPFCSFFSS